LPVGVLLLPEPTADPYTARIDAVLIRPTEKAYPINALRNISLRLATTELVFLLDADLVPSKGLQEYYRSPDHYSVLRALCAEEMGALIIPAVEFPEEDTLTPENSMMLQKSWENGPAHLRSLLEQAVVTPFCEKAFPQGHRATNFERCFSAEEQTSYEVAYEEGFEPYVIVHRRLVPFYDERFTGYGKNKVQSKEQLMSV
jgi:glycosyltransferase-like protein LARGE